jgi:hypothetical protein
MIFAWFVVGLVGVVLLGSRAVANGYLVVIYSRRRGLVLLEHGADELYHVVVPSRLPLALARYLLLYVAFSLLLLQRRVQASVQPRKTVALTAKA